MTAERNVAERRLERLVAFVTILAPTLGVVAVCVLAVACRTGPSPVDLALLASFFVVAQLGVTAGFHRLVAHRSFTTGPIVEALLVGAGSMALQGSVVFWVSVHRLHHRSSDREGDPHSPNLAGLMHAHMGWMLSLDRPPDWAKNVHDLLRDDGLFRLNRRYLVFALFGLAAPAAIGGAVTGSWAGALSGFLWGGLVRVFVGHHMTWAVNSLGHRLGSRPYETDDRSGNVPLLALVTLGESWHNNHHAFPSSARHGLRSWQLDLTYGFIRLLERVGAAWDLQRAPSPGGPT